MSSYASQLHEEQQAVDRAYGRLDDLRAEMWQRLDTVRAAGSHGSPTQRTERDSFATMYEDRLTQLRSVEDRLVFGRLDSKDGTRHYIGRIGLSSTDHEPILTDWRAEAARPFYEATPSNHGNIVMRRHITLSFRNVVGVEDEVLDVHSDQVGQASSAGTLTGEGALLASLSSRRTGKMTDIVATIQAEQDRIIRSDMNRAVVVQGGPGTGKTAVALHRAAYLLYTHRRTLERSGVLVVGPSSAFLHYIDQVLPSLGETGVVSRTISDLIPGITATATDTPYTAKLKGDRRMAQVVANAIASRIRIPANLPTVTISGIQVPMLAVDIQQAQTDAKRTRQAHNKARETFIRSMLSSMQRRYAEQLDYTPDQAELNRAMQLLRMNDTVRKTLNLCWLPMTGPWLIDQLFAHPERLKSLAGWLSDDDIRALARPKGSPLTKSDIPLLDEAMELLGPDPKVVARKSAADARRAAEEQYAKDTLAATGLGQGIVSSQMLLDQMNGTDAELTSQRAAADREWTYGHIVVDEAQELTAMDWRMLMRRCPSRSFTIVGDVAQTSALGGTRRWDKTMNRLFGAEHWDLNELTINYRNPQAVSDLASQFAQNEGLYISTVHAVRDVPGSVSRHTVDDTESLLQAIADQAVQLAHHFVSTDGTGRIAIICPDSLIEPVRQHVRQSLSGALDSKEYQRLIDQPEWDEQISVCGTETVKGLEFDAVVVAEPAMIEDDAPSRLVAASDLYVAMTRPTQKLVIVRTKADEQSMNI
ncbi:ATP-dependent DNA helicase [Bifidobacterium saguini DSM 23967]|uniref:ATP-dependent DNA helicase n=2 Tax=Bifidobacterium saguini TaxID=762210 RepID=A0A087DCW3_9BIFI|nr:AAA family ATPase [Bifidobacterium saguini]KFI93363.1 ATP-dependent DNA helicase [Bifidobacterium saguini DSM 23967]QTB90571.1 AAA family ATPase [Bifidobacterium saguini]